MIWDNGYWHSEVYNENYEDICLTLEDKWFDSLVERVKAALPEMLELNFSYTGNVDLFFDIIRIDNLVQVAS
jgi:hypothetical protein